jgi:large subunit ribosomal protein L15
MNELSRLAPPRGARKDSKRIGRGIGSGRGKTAGRGVKGDKARAASKKPIGFEGGQMPLQRRLPKRGFKPIDRVEYQIVNVAALAELASGTEVTPELLASQGFVRHAHGLVKILGQGELPTRLTVKAHKFSKSAVEKIQAAGGVVEVIGG